MTTRPATTLSSSSKTTGLTLMTLQMARVFIFTAFVLAAMFFAPQDAFAQNTKTTTTSSSATTTTTTSTSGAKPPPKKTTVNFEDQLIEGQTAKPELFYLLQQRSPNFKRLIKLRENFIPEMQDTAEDMNRRRNAD